MIIIMNYRRTAFFAKYNSEWISAIRIYFETTKHIIKRTIIRITIIISFIL